jgi:PDZ domain-containing protein
MSDSAGPAPKPGRRLVRRTLVTAGTLAALIAAVGVWNWPTHTDAEQPGPILDLTQRLHIDGATTPVHGAYDGLTVVLQPLDLGHRLVHDVTGDPTKIIPDSALHPSDESDATYYATQKSAYVDGAQVAAAVAERALGLHVTVTTRGVTVDGVVAHSPAAKILAPGDLITAVNGKPLTTNSDLADAIRHACDHPVTLQVQTPTSTNSHTVVTTPVPTGAQQIPAIGVVVEPPTVDVQLAIPVTDNADGVEGPSAGLMTGLTIFDELSPVDVAAGRTIAGTGTLDIDGRVGDIGGIEAKARAAAAAGAQLFLAPADQAAAARSVLGTRIPVIGVTTFQQAIDALHPSTTPAA